MSLPSTGLSPSTVLLSNRVPVLTLRRYRGPTTPTTPKRYRFGLFRVRSPLLAESQLFSLPAGTKMFQFPAFASSLRMIHGLQPCGLPHSEMSGSMVVCTYPNLIAAYHVLLRLPEPRHPPFALSFFFFRFRQISLPDAARRHKSRHCLSSPPKFWQILSGTMRIPAES